MLPSSVINCDVYDLFFEQVYTSLNEFEQVWTSFQYCCAREVCCGTPMQVLTSLDKFYIPVVQSFVENKCFVWSILNKFEHGYTS